MSSAPQRSPFGSRRELAVEVRDDHVVGRLQKVAHHDWEHSRPLDFSDEGLLADLEDSDGGSTENLVLDAGDEKKKHKH